MMLLRIKITFLLLTFLGCAPKVKLVKGKIGSDQDNEMIYCGQPTPKLKPEIFAPEFISKTNRNEFGICFSKSGTEVYYGVDIKGKAEIHFSKLVDGVWTKPQVILQDSIFSFNDPMLSNAENKLYFISNKSDIGNSIKKDYDIWYIERNQGKWSIPINAGETINSNKNEYYISFSEAGSIYYSTNKYSEQGKEYNFDIFSAEKRNDTFLNPTKLDSNINTNRYEADVFISPDESYIIFCGKYRGGLGMGDLYISFKDEENNWLPSINMGELINTDKHELCPFVTKDGRHFFYTSNQNIYWVSTEIFKSLKNIAGDKR